MSPFMAYKYGTPKQQFLLDSFKQAIQEDDVRIAKADIVRFDEYAKRWRILGAYSSSSSLFDMIKSTAVAHAILSEHRHITGDEYRFLNMLEGHISSPFEPVKLRILQLAHQGRSIRDICIILGQDPKTYRPYVSNGRPDLGWVKSQPTTTKSL